MRLLSEFCLPFVRPGGVWVAAKGANPEVGATHFESRLLRTCVAFAKVPMNCTPLLFVLGEEFARSLQVDTGLSQHWSPHFAASKAAVIKQSMLTG